MKLIDALESAIRIRLICKSCGAHQPAYLDEMIDRHGPDTELDVAQKRAPCFFCKAVGNFTTLVPPSDGSGVREL